ncbi:hypothetical protein BBP40_002241 [Aspergillus hancockii]|nr:hypothetical protein BBP40_002241 [Aspergillus hancockii]
MLCTSYVPIAAPPRSDLDETTSYRPAISKVRWFFCSICGSHLLRERPFETGAIWEVATGVLNKIDGVAHIARHTHVADTTDGGLTNWIQNFNNTTLPKHSGSVVSDGNSMSAAPLGKSENGLTDTSGYLQGSCHCGRVRLHVTRPNDESREARSPFPDVMIPEHTHDPQVPNPNNEPWWLQANGTKYLAGTCACRSCRLGSGFEIQPWAFVPRCNIFIATVQAGNGNTSTWSWEVLDFAHRPAGSAMRSFNSSPGGTYREFCGTCGATIFWHNDEWRPAVIDISVGIFQSNEGALATDWLEWWTGRVSYEEEPEKDRPSRSLDEPYDLIPSLSRGLRDWNARLGLQ